MSTELMNAGKQEWQSIHCRGCQVFPVIDKITPVKKYGADVPRCTLSRLTCTILLTVIK